MARVGHQFQPGLGKPEIAGAAKVGICKRAEFAGNLSTKYVKFSVHCNVLSNVWLTLGGFIAMWPPDNTATSYY